MKRPQINLATRKQQVLEIIQAKPDATLQEIGNKLGVTRERIRQVCVMMTQEGVILHRADLRKDVIKQRKTTEAAAKIEVREHRKKIWRKMMYIGRRLRLRHMARIDQYGIVRDYHMPGQEATCQFSGCTRPVDARGFCGAHYARLRATGALWVRRRSRKTCKELNCGMPVYARNMCTGHYEKYRRQHPIKSHLIASNTSGYRGVTWQKKDHRWVATIHPKGKQISLGLFNSKEMAARAYDTAARIYFGEHAKLNFPNDTSEVTAAEPRKQADRVSGVVGVTWDNRDGGKWVVRITRNKKKLYVGRFIDMEDAIRARTEAEQSLARDTKG